MGDNPTPVAVGGGIREAGPEYTLHGARFIPDYIERCPPMWAVGDIDMMAISALESEARGYFSLGSFFFGIGVNIVLGASLSSTPLSEVGNFLLYKGSAFLGVMALIFFGLGWRANERRTSIWERIKKESRPKQVS